jgi:hypothetical protein
MKFLIIADKDGGFTVRWVNPAMGDKEVATVGGFSTEAAAQIFIQDLLMRVVREYKTPTAVIAFPSDSSKH